MQPVRPLKNSRRRIAPCLSALGAFALTALTAAYAGAPPPWDAPVFGRERVAPKRAPALKAPVISAANGTFRLHGQGGGVLTFDTAVATSRPGLKIAAIGGGQALYHLTTPDTLRKLAILNPGKTPWQIVGRDGILGEGVAEGAFIAFDDVSGKIVSVAVYQINRATESEPQIVRVGENIVLRGRFLAVADARQGRNILQRGASEIRLNAQTGIVVKTR